jgi:hypothetical protein
MPPVQPWSAVGTATPILIDESLFLHPAKITIPANRTARRTIAIFLIFSPPKKIICCYCIAAILPQL